jgi:hypothetical protein
VGTVAESCWNLPVFFSVNCGKNCQRMTCIYLSRLTVSLKKNTGLTILLALTAHQTPSFAGRSRTRWVWCGFCELQYRLLCVFMNPCKWNHALSEKNVNCRSISLLRTDFKNEPASWRAQLQGVNYCYFIGSKLQ